MNTRVRTGATLALAGLATSGLALLASAPADASPGRSIAAPGVCHYTVNARSGLNVRTGPGTQYRIVGALSYGQEVQATCKSTHGGVQLRGGVPAKFRNKWVARGYLTRLMPNEGIDTGAGGTARK